MAGTTTLYEFRADLKGLVDLNKGLKKAKDNLDLLKKGTAQYNTQLKKVSTSMAMMNSQGKKMSGMVSGIKKVNSEGNRMISTFKSASIAIASAFAFRAIIGGITGVIKSFSDFESRMAAVKAISGATDEEFQKLTKSAIKLGSTTVFTATQVAALQEEFARLGFSTKEILAAQAATLDLAAATGEDLSKAAAIAGSSLRAFGLEAEQIQRVVNVMGAAFTNSALNLERFTQSMKFVAPVGKAAGFTIEETTSLLMNLADAGLHGSIAGNGLKNIFIKLGDANSKLRKEIGHSVQGLPQMIEVLRGMKEESFNFTDAVELLDKRSAPAFLSLLENIDGLEANLSTLNGAEGIISQMAAIRLDTLEGDFTLLKSATEGLGIAVGESFNLSIRQAIYTFTLFIQGLQEGSGFVDTLKSALQVLRSVVVGFTLKFLYLKLAMGPSMFIGAIKAVGLFSVSLRALVTRTQTVSVALKGMRAAMSSTGVGLLVVALGYLIDKLFLTSKEVGELEMKMGRTIKSFNKEIKAVTELTIASQERHDALRKLNTAYPELLGNIDLEVLSNKELLKVLKLVNDTKGLRMAMSENQDDIANIDKKASEDIIMYQKKIITNEQDLIKFTEKKQWLEAAGSRGAIDRYKKNIEIIETQAETEKAILLETGVLFEEQLDKKIKESSIASKFTDEELKTYRIALREGYKGDLESFRDMMYKKQLLRKLEVEHELEQMQQISDIHDLFYATSGDKFTPEGWEDYTNAVDELDASGKKLLANTPMDGAVLDVKISELQQHNTDLKALLDKIKNSGGGSSRSKNLTGFKLENTKNQLKALFDLQNKMIADTEEQEIDAADKAFTFKQQKFQKEQDLMYKNIESIEQISEQGSDKQIRADIKKNKSKYDILKNMDMEEWDNLMNRKKTNNADLLVILDAMALEEHEKLKTNQGIERLIFDEHEKEKLIIIAKYQAIRRTQAIEIHQSELKMEDDSIINFFKKREKKTALLEKSIKHEEKLLLAKYTTGEISEKQYLEQLAVLDADSSAKRLDDKSSRIQEEIAMYKDMYSQIFDAASSVWNNIQEMKMKSIEETHTSELEELNGKQERELEMYEGNSEAQENINKTYEERKDVLEDKKNEKITHIKRQQFRLDKANSIAMALINGYQAITKVSAETGVAAIIAAPIMAGLIAVQVAAIASQKFIGARGGIIPEGDKFARGGVVKGASHAQGGVNFNVGGRQVELEGKEVVVNARSSELFAPLLSDINSHNNWGDKFARGGITPGTGAVTNRKSGGFNTDELAFKIAGAVNNKQVFVVESDISGAQNTVAISESNAVIF